MALLDSNFLQTLINSGPDAQSNLYEVVFTSSDSTSSDDIQSRLRCRVSNFSIPSIEENTTSIPYQNTNVEIITNGLSLTKKITLNIRLDSNYEIYNYLLDKLCVNTYGDFELDPSKSMTIDVFPFTYGTSADPTPDGMYNVPELGSPHMWSFYDCYITSVGTISYTYLNSGIISIPISFIYSTMELTDLSS